MTLPCFNRQRKKLLIARIPRVCARTRVQRKYFKDAKMKQSLSARRRERLRVMKGSRPLLARSRFHLRLQEISLKTRGSSQQLSQRIKLCNFTCLQSLRVNTRWGCLRETTLVNFDPLLMRTQMARRQRDSESLYGLLNQLFNS